jgi:hypothetical protein
MCVAKRGAYGPSSVGATYFTEGAHLRDDWRSRRKTHLALLTELDSLLRSKRCYRHGGPNGPGAMRTGALASSARSAMCVAKRGAYRPSSVGATYFTGGAHLRDDWRPGRKTHLALLTELDSFFGANAAIDMAVLTDLAPCASGREGRRGTSFSRRSDFVRNLVHWHGFKEVGLREPPGWRPLTALHS